VTYTYKLSRRLASSHETARTLRPIVLLLLALLATACGTGELTSTNTPDADRATPGWVTLSFSTPRTDDGAVQLRVLGPSIDSLELTGTRGFTSLSGGTLRVLLTGPIASGPVARFWVSDTRKASVYVATVEEAAARSTYLLQDLSQGYAARVTR
jgi:hypothetical protein